MAEDRKQGTRAFLALSTPAGTKASLEELRRRIGGLLQSARFVPPERIHLTLHFFASLKSSEIEAVKTAARTATAGMEPFEVMPGGVGVFPHPRRPRVLWVGVREGEQRVTRLASEIGAALSGTGLVTRERPLTPHVTVARLRDPRQPRLTEALDAGAGIAFKAFSVDRVILFESRLGPEGPRYSTLGEYPLSPQGVP